MYFIPWINYSEEEIQEVVSYLYQQRSFFVYNIHKVDRRGEMGADLECTKKGETEKILIAVKKKPQKKDELQLQTFAEREAKTKIYIYIEEPSASFSKKMNSIQSRVSFWNADKLTLEIFNTSLRFYIYLIIENYYEKPSFNITRLFFHEYVKYKEDKNPKKEPLKLNDELLKILWNAKDRSVALNKSFRTLQEIFENCDLSGIDKKLKRTIVSGFIRGLFFLRDSSLKPIEKLFNEFILKYPDTFKEFCRQTDGRSNWLYFFSHVPKLLPSNIIKSIEEADKELEKTQIGNEYSINDESVSDILGSVSQNLGHDAYWLEDTVDDLLSICLSEDMWKTRFEFSDSNIDALYPDGDEESNKIDDYN